MTRLALIEEMDRRGFRATRFDGYHLRCTWCWSIADLDAAMQEHRVMLIIIYAGRAGLPPDQTVLAVGYRLGFPAYAGTVGAGEEEWRTFVQFAGAEDLVDAIDHATGWLVRQAAGRVA